MAGNFATMLASREQLIQIEQKNNSSSALPKKTKIDKLGCANCPSNTQRDVHKLFTKVTGKKLMVFWQNPNVQENNKKKPLLGQTAQWFWEELQKVGIERDETDVQYAVRCLPVDDDDSVRQPSGVEIKCCSKHTGEALEKSKATVYIIIGAIAARQVCGVEYRKDQRIFWSDKLNAKVYCLEHPGSFLYGNHKGKTGRIDAFREALAAAAAEIKGKKPPKRYSFLESMDYKPILTVSAAKKEARRIRRYAAKGERCAMDLENYPIDGVDTPLVLGACSKPGRARVFVLGHPKVKKVDGKWQGLPRKVVKRITRVIIDLLEDASVRKVFHHGSHDAPTMSRFFECKVNGYDFDTEYGEYFADPNAKSYGLGAIVGRKFPEFVGYKAIVMPEAIPRGYELPDKYKKLPQQPLSKQYDYYRKRNLLNYAQLPLRKMVLYNGGDCDTTKRSEVSVRDKVPYELLQVYIDDGFVLDKMQKNGPMFDFKHSKRLIEFYPPKEKALLKELQEETGKICKAKVLKFKDPKKWEALDDKKKTAARGQLIEFNPRSPDQVKYVIFKKLAIEFPEELLRKRGAKANTQKLALEVMGKDNKFPRTLLAYRKVARIISQYLKGYIACARNNNGRMQTKWWLTGTATGRLSSGGGREKDEANVKVVNLQNVHGDRNLKNLLVPDTKWREMYRAMIGAIERVVGEIKPKFIKPDPKKKDKELRIKTVDGKLLTKDDLISRLKKSKRWKKICIKLIKKFGDFPVFLGYDFGQIEVRVMAQISDDEVLISDCLSGDIHSAVGHRMTGWAIMKIKKDKKTRTLTKNIHFGILFGLAEEGVYAFIKAKDPDNPITPELAQKYYRAYFKRYKGVARFVQFARGYVEKHGFIKNIFGFKRVLIENNDISFDDEGDDYMGSSADEGGAYWGNQALNTPVQGAAHQLMLMALAALKRKKKTYKLLQDPTMEVHDALIFMVKLKYLAQAFVKGKQLLEREPLKMVKKYWPKIKWKVPLEVEGNAGLRIGDMVDGEENHKVHSIEQLIAAMALETYESESKLMNELAAAA